jgi:predicted neuraminidase
VGLFLLGAEQVAADQAGVVHSGFVYTKAPFAQCHASTIVETPSGLVAAWFAGTREGHTDVGVWLARHLNGHWTAPIEVANGVEPAGKRYPCWNPVLFAPQRGPLMLFYKVGPSPRTWWGMLITSRDNGKSWSNPQRLPDGVLGPIKNKPIQLRDGAILCGSSKESNSWEIFMHRTADLGKTWTSVGPLNDREQFSAIQPTVLSYSDSRLQILCRSRQNRLTQCWSNDGGKSWNKMTATSLPNPNAGADGVTLADGRQLLVYNHTIRGGSSPRGREMLNVSMSSDGNLWQAALILENSSGEFSYPAVIQTSDGWVHTTYTWRRQRVKHIVIDPKKLVLRDIDDDKWPLQNDSR